MQMMAKVSTIPENRTKITAHEINAKVNRFGAIQFSSFLRTFCIFDKNEDIY